ncbi:hypothetical protein MTR67_018928 [Solanum verrucosum]|uniref:Uncharacterized protein n=1 Tax=Solanum verrucosum TaxID=315347 RepID=A0AAF0QLX7_SOLVR|nr:hypothetical protein MTR67_018928 [Solanum verrucosum]
MNSPIFPFLSTKTSQTLIFLFYLGVGAEQAPLPQLLARFHSCLKVLVHFLCSSSIAEVVSTLLGKYLIKVHTDLLSLTPSPLLLF